MEVRQITIQIPVQPVNNDYNDLMYHIARCGADIVEEEVVTVPDEPEYVRTPRKKPGN